MEKNDWLDSLSDDAYEYYEILCDEIADVESEIDEITDILRNPMDVLDDWDYITQTDIDRYVESLQQEVGRLEIKLDDLAAKRDAYEADNGHMVA